MRTLLFLLILTSCFSSVIPKYEPTSLPSHPNQYQIPEHINDLDFIEPLNEGACNDIEICPQQDGFFVSESLLLKQTQYKLSYDELRKLYENDMKYWNARNELFMQMEKQLHRKDIFQKISPYLMSFSFIGGIVISMLLLDISN